MAGLHPEDIARLVEVSDPKLSPDGRFAVVVVTSMDEAENAYRSTLWMVQIDGGAAPRALTAGTSRDTSPAWSPDGSRLAFLSDREGTGKGSQLRLLPLAGGESELLCGRLDDVADLAWAPDGSRLGFTARPRLLTDTPADRDRPPRRIDVLGPRGDGSGWVIDRRRHLFVVDAVAGAEPRQLTDGLFDHRGAAWRPDSLALVTAAGRHQGWDRDGSVDLWLVTVENGSMNAITETGPAYALPAWSGDGRRLACRSTDPSVIPSHGRVVVIDTTTGSVTVASAALDRNCCPSLAGARAPVWDRESLLFQADDSGNVPLLSVPASGGAVDTVVGGERQVTGFDRAAGTLVAVIIDLSSPGDLAVVEGERTRFLTSFGADAVEPFEVARAERFGVTSADGTEVEAWLMRPVGAVEGERYPTIVNIHGGPFSQYGNRFFDEFQIQAGAGYCVVFANPRGSSGYSEAFGRAIRGPNAAVAPGGGWGSVDFADVMAVVDEAGRRFECVDPERVGLIGGSYGGYLTSWAVGHTDRFVAAVSERAVNNLHTMTFTSDIGVHFNEGYVGVGHLDDPDEYRRQSPITYVGDIHTPLLILHSEEDWRCPISQAEELFVDLHLLGREVEFVRFPGEGHELSRSGSPSHRIERGRLILDWFGRHLQ